jgi:5-methylcytosine-specific restriction endonuclease McrA
MSSNKKAVREAFRNAVFKRDGNRCKACGDDGNDGMIHLDAHHITDRNLMPAGGYVKENGISLCPTCHQSAEAYHQGDLVPQGFMPSDLYVLIGSSIEMALAASKKLEKQQNAG